MNVLFFMRTVGFRSLFLLLAVGCCAPTALGQLVIAHRGASHAAPENTLAAFRLAWEEGADGVEGDFYLTTDGKIVCIHDRTTKRVAGKDLKVAKSSFAELRALDVGSWKGPEWKGERIPTLAEVMATVPRGKLIFVELKMGPEIVAPLAKELAVSTVPLENVIIICFNEKTIAECERVMPELKSYWLTGYKQKDDQSWSPTAEEVVDVMQRIKADGLGSKALPEYFNRGFLAKLRAGGITDYHVWTVDDPAVADIYQKEGAWSITTNQPEMIRASLAD